MSELIQRLDNRATIRWKLLTSVSAAALAMSAYAAGEAQAADNDTDRPLLWVELTGQLEQQTDVAGTLAPSFLNAFTVPALNHALDVQKPRFYAVDGQAKVLFQPEDSSWVFSGAIQIGRSVANRFRHHQTKNANVHYGFFLTPSKYRSGSLYPSRHRRMAQGQSAYSEHHTIIDFRAGKDVGLGFLGEAKGSSVISGGVRFAQFRSKSNVTLRGEPDVQYPSGPLTSIPAFAYFKYERPPLVFHDFAGNLDASRSFHGIGPTVSWDASLPMAGNTADGELDFDWSIDAAALFGRQRVKGHHQTTAKTYHLVGFQKNNNQGINGYDFIGYFTPQAPYAVHPTGKDINRERSIIVPNIGASIGLSLRYADAKVSFGYRYDTFLNAMDKGIDARKTSNMTFNGPYASISIGIGD
jgi:hypothetical protein